MRVASTQWCIHFFNLIIVESGTNSGFGIVIVLARSLGGIVRINGITTVLKLISSADTPAAAGVTELFLRIAGVQLCSFAHFVLRREDPFPIHGQNFNELWSRRLGYACRRVTADIILNLEVSFRAFQPCANSSELSWVLPGTIILVLYALLLEIF
jgi:hypothetical protein